MVAGAGCIDVLEEGEPLEPELEAARGQVASKAMKEKAQHFVDVDHDQRPVGVDRHGAKLGQQVQERPFPVNADLRISCD